MLYLSHWKAMKCFACFKGWSVHQFALLAIYLTRTRRRVRAFIR